MTKETIKATLPSITNFSLESLWGNPLPMYGKTVFTRSAMQTVHWMDPRDMPSLHLLHWKTISSLCYFSRLGMCRTWANKALVIYYRVHVRRGMPIYPLLLKQNGKALIQIDCTILSTGSTSYVRPFPRAVYLGMRYYQIEWGWGLKADIDEILRNTMPLLLDFFAGLGQPFPLVIALPAEFRVDAEQWATIPCKMEYLHIGEHLNYRLMSFARSI